MSLGGPGTDNAETASILLSLAVSEMFVDIDGVWIEPISAGTRGPALFLDRDGVIVEDHGFLQRPDDVHLIEGAAQLIHAVNQLGIAVVVVTNQSGIGRGLFDWVAFARVEAEIRARLAAESATLDAVLACPHHPNAIAPYTRVNSPDRKPNPGMILKAATLLNLQLDQSWIIGDRVTDLLAGRRARLAGGLHVATGEGNCPDERRAALAIHEPDSFTVQGIASIAEAKWYLPWFNG